MHGNGAPIRPVCLDSLEPLCQRGHVGKAVDLLFQLNGPASTKVYLCLLQACNRNKGDLWQASRIFAHMVHYGASRNTFLGDYLAMTLAKCGAVDYACQVASSLPRRSILTWAAIISAFVECGRSEEAIQLHHHMLEDRVEPNSYVYVGLLKACGKILDLDSGKKLHAEARSRGLATHVFVSSTLVSMYGKCGAITEAEDVFLSVTCRDPVCWNAMLTAYIETNRAEQALQLFRQMKEEAVTVDHSTLILALQALADMEGTILLSEGANRIQLKRVGQALHAEARKKGLASDIIVGSALLSMYGNYGCIEDADNVFASLFHRDVVSWNAMISAYLDLGSDITALQFYVQMCKDGLSPDQTTFMMTFRACRNITDDPSLAQKHSNRMTAFELGRALHDDAHKLGYTSDTQVANTLVSMYGKCGAIFEAESVFNELPCQGVVSWTVLLCAYVENGHPEKALDLYKEMQLECVLMDDIAILYAFQTCGILGVVEMCRRLHTEITSANFDNDLAIVATMLNSYKSCALMSDACACFHEVVRPTTVFWNACMDGHALEGSHMACLAMFQNMKATCIKPDEFTFIFALSACRHTGLVDASLNYLESLSQDYDLIPNAKHYGVVVDLLGRVGDFKKLYNLIKQTPYQTDAAIWLSLLGASGTHDDFEIAMRAFERVMEVAPGHCGAYIMLSKACQKLMLPDSMTKMEYHVQIQGAKLLGGH
ncbi:hypothetical protein KP509_06G051200 [Ceratopteris richardii]|uniref:Pentatricopeptide repeat-containing protein n=1 Tax=Ceratopteris richardii TaxID=49495 RepID=A0A8T2UP32_CERRI|nr:hypothetical protein KP509_06G051200 [Ceratopteris richardii]